MTRFALLPPDIQALERERQMLSARLGFLNPRSRRARSLRRRSLALTARLLQLEAALHERAAEHITHASLGACEPQAFQRRYWWDEL